MISLIRRVYGASPLHLLGQLVALAIAAYAFVQVVQVASTDTLSLAVWFLGGALLHDLLFVPIYLVLDRVARHGVRAHARRRVGAINHIRFPAAISAAMFLTLFPLILSRGEPNYIRTAGLQPPSYLGHWLLVTALVFGVSALAYAVRLRHAGKHHPPSSAAGADGSAT